MHDFDLRLIVAIVPLVLFVLDILKYEKFFMRTSRARSTHRNGVQRTDREWQKFHDQKRREWKKDFDKAIRDRDAAYRLGYAAAKNEITQANTVKITEMRKRIELLQRYVAPAALPLINAELRSNGSSPPTPNTPEEPEWLAESFRGNGHYAK